MNKRYHYKDVPLALAKIAINAISKAGIDTSDIQVQEHPQDPREHPQDPIYADIDSPIDLNSWLFNAVPVNVFVATYQDFSIINNLEVKPPNPDALSSKDVDDIMNSKVEK